MGHIRDRWRDPARKGKGRRWQLKYSVDGRERDGGSFDNREVAKRKLIELESAVHRGQWVDPSDQTTVTELVRAYVATRMHRPSTAARAESAIRNHVAPTQLGSRRAAAVRPSEAQAWITDRSKHLAPSTMVTLVTMVRGAYSAAVLDRVVAVSPFGRVTLPRVEREELVPLTRAQVEALADTVGDRYRALVITQAGLGLRIGELFALRTIDVDFLRRTARVEHQIDRTTRERVDPKTPRARRTLPLPDVVAQALARHLATYPAGADGLIFHTRAGRPYHREQYATGRFVPAVAKVNMAADQAAAEGDAAAVRVPVGTTSHDLRHHYASELVAAGVSVIEVAGLLGHEDATQVIKVYGHRVPGSEDRVRRAIDAVWATSSGPSLVAVTAQGRPG